MRNFEIRKLQKQYHVWSEHIDSYDYHNTPKDLRATITDAEYDSLLRLPYQLVPDLKKIIVNESFSGWETVKDIFITLDCMPVKYLKDIYEANKKRFENVELNNIVGNDEEVIAQIMFCLIPDVIWTKE